MKRRTFGKGVRWLMVLLAACLWLPSGGGSLAADPVNLVSNPGFENGLQSWGSWGNIASTQVSGNVHSGTTALSVTGPGGGYQDITTGVTSNTSYTLSAWGKRAGTGGAAFIGVKFKNASGGVISESSAIYWTELAYTQHSGTFTTPTGTVSLQLYAYVNSGAAGLFLDDVILTGGEPPVGSGTNYYVATNGNDSNPGTLASPFLTVQKAASVAIAGDTVNIRAGTYYEEVTPAYTGTSGHPITFQAYNGEAVTISGLARVTSTWTLHSGNVYKTTTALNLGSKNAVFADGEMMVPARWPNVGSWLDKSPALADNATSSTSGTTAILKGAATGPQMPNLNWAGAKVWAYVNWIGWTSPISASSNNQLTLTNNAPDGNTQLGYELNFAPIQYYIYDSLQALDTNKEWYYDAAAQTLYLYAPNGGSPSGYTIEKKVRESAFTLDGLSYIDIKGLTINGATIKASSSNHIRLDGLKLKNFGYDADSTGRYGSQLDIGLILKGDGIELRNSEIYNSSGYGIYITGNDAVIFNNYIHDIGYAGAFTSAFSVDGANAHISYNTLKRAGSTCTGGNMTFGALIEYNDFSYCGMISNDNGTMHWAKNDYQNTEIRYNYFHDGQDGAAHIYVDNASSNLLIHHNTVYNTSVSGKRAVLINQPANYIQFYNNMIDGSFVANSAQVFQDDTYKMAVYDNVFTEGYSITGPARVSNNSTAQGEFAMITGPGGTPGHNFTAPPTEPALSFTNHPDRNLVRNAGFEGMLDHYHVPNDLRYWTKTGAMNAVGQLSEHESINQDHGYTRTGEGSVRLGGGQDGIEQTITGLAPNTYYEIAGWAKVSTGEQARIGAKLYDASGGDTYATVTDTQGGWVRNIMTFKTGSQATSATIYLNKTTSGSGYVYGDDFGLVYLGATLPPPPPPAPGDNLLTNPGFEQDYASWSNGVNVTVDTANAHDGAKAIRVNSGAAGSGNQDASGGVVAGADYIVSAWGKLGAAGVTGAKLTVRAKNSAGQYITGSGVDAALSWSETVYTRKAVKFTMPT
ncbi:MAG: carbohydrate binding domain-containing protein, partial [Paenibacillaceae bacterium]|nr:carbohydrate binding domain-containing protein [Paenibacillaceae bacterium]